MGELITTPDAVLACVLAPKALRIEGGYCTPVSGKERCDQVLKSLEHGVQRFEGEQCVLVAGGGKVDTAVWDDVAVGVYGSFENMDYLRGKVEADGDVKEAGLVARLFRKFGEAASLTKIWGAHDRGGTPSDAPRAVAAPLISLHLSRRCCSDSSMRHARLLNISCRRAGQFSFIACDLKNDRVFAARSTLSPVELIEASPFIQSSRASFAAYAAVSDLRWHLPSPLVAAALCSGAFLNSHSVGAMQARLDDDVIVVVSNTARDLLAGAGDVTTLQGGFYVSGHRRATVPIQVRVTFFALVAFSRFPPRAARRVRCCVTCAPHCGGGPPFSAARRTVSACV